MLVIRLVKQNQLTFFSIEISKPLPAPVYSVRPTLVVNTDQIPDHTYTRAVSSADISLLKTTSSERSLMS